MSMELIKNASIVVTIPNSEAVVKNQLKGIEDRTVGMFYTNDNGARKEEIMDFFNNFNDSNIYQINILKTKEYSKYVTKHIFPLEDKFKYGLSNYKENILTFKNSNSDYIKINSISLSENNNSRYLKFDRNDDISNKFYNILLGDISTLVITKIDEFTFELFPSIQISSILENIRNETFIDSGDKEKGGYNKIYYGAPGCGKSQLVKRKLKPIEEEDDSRIIRTTFHPEYSNSDFVGQILPKIDEENNIVTYEFNPGPFTLALKKALSINKMVYLVIEEINRGNAAAIFGDLFQLLDREKAHLDNGDENPKWGTSEYPITNPNMQKYLGMSENDKVYIPSNLTIIATMNTSDQNVFTLDTAFKRRWSSELVDNDIVNDTNHPYKKWYVPYSNVTWEKFLINVNEKIVSSSINQISEDKRMGKYFVNKECLVESIDEDAYAMSEAAKNFAYKVLEYLWNDVCKINKDEWFDLEKYKTLEDLITDFIAGCEAGDSLQVFKDSKVLFENDD